MVVLYFSVFKAEMQSRRPPVSRGLSAVKSKPVIKDDKKETMLHSLFVQGLPLALDSAGLKTFFSSYGEVSPTTRVIRDHGYGFVDFFHPESVEATLKANSPLLINGFRVRVERTKKVPSDINSGSDVSLTSASSSDFSNSTQTTASTPVPEDPRRFRNAVKEIHQTPKSPTIANDRWSETKPAEPKVVITNNCKRIIVPLIPEETTAADLESVFSVFGKVTKVFLRNDLDHNLSSAATLWTIRAQFDNFNSVQSACNACRKEGLPVMKFENNFILVGIYQDPPNLVNALESFAHIGFMISAELLKYETGCSIEFESDEDAVRACSAPVCVRGVKLAIQIT